MLLTLACTPRKIDEVSISEQISPEKLENRHALAENNAMRELTVSARSLLTTAFREDISPPDRHRIVIENLLNLENTTLAIKRDASLKEFARLSPYLHSFLQDIRLARNFAELSPPNYHAATWLIKSCLQCHKNI